MLLSREPFTGRLTRHVSGSRFSPTNHIQTIFQDETIVLPVLARHECRAVVVSQQLLPRLRRALHPVLKRGLNWLGFDSDPEGSALKSTTIPLCCKVTASRGN